MAGYGCPGWTRGGQRDTEEVLAVLEEVAGSGRVNNSNVQSSVSSVITGLSA